MFSICRKDGDIDGKLGELGYGSHEIRGEDESSVERGGLASSKQRLSVGLMRKASRNNLRE